MSLNNEICVFCHTYLFEDDDVVYCPECGAPHHRECYNKHDKCALVELHGTENQYDKLKKASEEQKEKEEQEEAEKNRTNSTNYETPFGTFSPFDFLGGVNPEEEIEDGIKAKEAAKFVLTNTMRYIPKFKKFKTGKKASWNFLGFLCPSAWLFSRKMYVKGFIAAVIEVLSTLLTVPFQKTVYELGISGMALSPQVMQKISENIDKIPSNILYVALFGSLMYIALMILTGIFGDFIYKKYTVNSIKEINKSSEDKEALFRKNGGVNIFWFLISYMAVKYIPIIIISFI